MALPNLYKAKTATFKTKAITGVQSFQIDFQGSTQMARGDGVTGMQLVYTEGVHARVTVTALEGQVSDADLNVPGAYGSLVLKGAPQTAGKGLGTEKTFTFAKAMLEAPSRSATNEGNPTVTYTFICVEEDGAEGSIMAVT
jgi:hypothetical protein